ncbi:MAG: hypothetical protein ACLGIA_09770 [Actinomycetes bacterium]
MTQDTFPEPENEREGIDKTLSSGVADQQAFAPGADAAADADPAQDQERYAEVVRDDVRRSSSADPEPVGESEKAEGLPTEGGPAQAQRAQNQE